MYIQINYSEEFIIRGGYRGGALRKRPTASQRHTSCQRPIYLPIWGGAPEFVMGRKKISKASKSLERHPTQSPVAAPVHNTNYYPQPTFYSNKQLCTFKKKSVQKYDKEFANFRFYLIGDYELYIFVASTILISKKVILQTWHRWSEEMVNRKNYTYIHILQLVWILVKHLHNHNHNSYSLFQSSRLLVYLQEDNLGKIGREIYSCIFMYRERGVEREGERERERERRTKRERVVQRKTVTPKETILNEEVLQSVVKFKLSSDTHHAHTNTHQHHTHTQSQRERERERGGEVGVCIAQECHNSNLKP